MRVSYILAYLGFALVMTTVATLVTTTSEGAGIHLGTWKTSTIPKLLSEVDFQNPRFGKDISFTRTQLSRGIYHAARNWLRNTVGAESAEKIERSALKGDDPYAYFRFFPTTVGRLYPYFTSNIDWSGACFDSIHAHVADVASDLRSLTIEFTPHGAQKEFMCSETLLLSTLEGVEIVGLNQAEQTVKVNWTMEHPLDVDYTWDLKTNGIRVHMIPENLITAVGDILATVSLFEPMEQPTVSDEAAKRNIDFLKNYAGVTPKLRKDDAPLDDFALYAQPGDFVGVMRLDGLDPLLAWAMGSTTGHTCVVLRDPETGIRYVAESTTNSAFWPQNGIQITELALWTKQAQAAGSSAIWAPLTAEARRNFDERKAWQYFKSLEGFDYGYYNFLFGWLDTASDNYPCLAPDFKRCFTRDTVELLLTLIERLSEPFATRMVIQAFQQRVGVKLPSLVGILRYASQHIKGDPLTQLLTMVERDDFVYNTTRYDKPTLGPSRVCCAFVCSVWKASGIFNPFGANATQEINCAEQTNWDVYSLNVLEKAATNLTSRCASANPGNPHCQFTGKYTLELNDVGTRKPYANMGETCPSKAPDYFRQPGC